MKPYILHYIDFDIPLDIPTNIKVPTNLDTEMEDEDDSEEFTEEEELRKEQEKIKKKESQESKEDALTNVFSDNKPQIWSDENESDPEKVKDTTEEYEDDFDEIEESIVEDAYAQKIEKNKHLMENTESFIQESKSDISKANKNDVSGSEKNKDKNIVRTFSKMKPQNKRINDMVDDSEDVIDITDDEILPSPQKPKLMPMDKKQSSEWNPAKQRDKDKKLIQNYLKDKEMMNENDRRVAEQELTYKKYNNAESLNDSRTSTPEVDSFDKMEKLSKHDSSYRSVHKQPSSKLEVVKETTIPNREGSTSEDEPIYTQKKDPEPELDERGNLKFEFKESNLPELDSETLALIRDQLLLQKMYENDLQNFKKFKKTKKFKKKRSAARTATSYKSSTQSKFIYWTI